MKKMNYEELIEYFKKFTDKEVTHVHQYSNGNIEFETEEEGWFFIQDGRNILKEFTDEKVTYVYCYYEDEDEFIEFKTESGKSYKITQEEIEQKINESKLKERIESVSTQVENELKLNELSL